MEVNFRHHYAAESDAVFAILTSPNLAIARCSAAGQHNAKVVEFSQSVGIVSMRIRSDVTITPASPPRPSLVPAVVWEQHEEWDPSPSGASHSGTWQITARGVPLTIGGTMWLSRAEGLGTLAAMNGEVRCSLPVLNATMTATFLAHVEQDLQLQAAFVDHYISAPRQWLD
ncbi:MAG: DUF2505 family protein [Actinobacteria bacterium]|nr:DUF2505 family protein [Actinomycetota bacterium]